MKGQWPPPTSHIGFYNIRISDWEFRNLKNLNFGTINQPTASFLMPNQSTALGVGGKIFLFRIDCIKNCD